MAKKNIEQHKAVRIAVIDYDKCQPEKCNWLCIRMCPVNRQSKECIVQDEQGKKPLISEELCTGCGICPHKCPFEAISIVNLTARLAEPLHQYGENMFRVYKHLQPEKGAVIGLIGRNGIGKSTLLNILSGNIIPNLGNLDTEASWESVLEHFRGKEIFEFIEQVSEKKIKLSYKPQQVDSIPKKFKGRVIDLLKKADEKGLLKKTAKELEIDGILEQDISSVSGGELQRIAIAAAMLKKADIYFFDEPTSYLDVRQRLRTAMLIRELADENTAVIVVEHDLSVLDYLSDYINVLFGKPNVYGVISAKKSVRNGINEFLDGFLRDENIKFRGEELRFEVKPPGELTKKKKIAKFPVLKKSFKGFELETESGYFREGEVIGILGPNAIGKTTFVKMLAGVEKPDLGRIDLNLKVSYKPQYLVPEKGKTVEELFSEDEIDSGLFESEIERKLSIKRLFPMKLEELSGGELQKVAVASALCRDSQLMLLDEPSAFIDVEDRLEVAELIKSVSEKKKRVSLVVDHDILFQDYVSDRLMVFEGEQSVKGIGRAPVEMHEGMNSFLKSMDVSFRRDTSTGRPRANKIDSVKDTEQKKKGEYYYSL